MSEERQVQEAQAEIRQEVVVREAQDVRTRVLDGLEALDRELQKVRREAEGIPVSPPRPTHKWRWPWAATFFSFS